MQRFNPAMGDYTIRNSIVTKINTELTSFPEEIKRYQVKHGVLNVVNLLFKR